MAILQSIKTLNNLLQEHGQGTDMPAKKAVWKLKGLDRRMGRYEGTPVQVNALIKSLKNNPLRFDPFTGKTTFEEENPVINIQTGQTLSQMNVPTTQPVQPAPQVQAPIVPATITPTTTEQKYILEHYGQDVYSKTFPTATNIPEGVGGGDTRINPTTGKKETLDPSGYWYETPTPTPIPTPTPTPTPTAPTATATLETLGITIPSIQDVYKEAMESPEYKNALEKIGIGADYTAATAAAAKEALETQFGKSKNKLEQNLAESGLAFSGIRTEQVKALTDELAASKLGVDRKLAVKLYEANKDLEDSLLKEVQHVIEDAQKGKDTAIAQLNKLGMAVVGDKIFNIPKEEEEKWSEPYLYQGDYVQKSEKTGQIRTVVNVPQPAISKYSKEDVSTYAQDILYGRLSLASVPAEIRTEVSAKVDSLRNTVRTRTDDEIRAMVRSQIITIQGELPKGKMDWTTQQKILNDVEGSETLTKPDKERIKLIISEWGIK